MTFGLLALITTAGLAGPLLAALPRLGLPLVVGEIAAGVLLGRTGLGWIDAAELTTAFLSEVGFAMLMFVVGTHLPLRDPGLRGSVRPAVLAALLTIGLAVPAGFALALVGPDRPLVLAVVVATSSAAVALPILLGGSDGHVGKATGEPAAAFAIGWITLTDVGTVLAVPLVLATGGLGTVLAGAGLVLLVGGAAFLPLRWLRHTDRVHALRRKSKHRGWALDLRVGLAGLFGLAALAVAAGTSILVAGFTAGAVLAAVGEPRRLAQQLVGVAEGFLVPLFFVTLGARLEFGALLGSGRALLLLAGLVVAATSVHVLVAVLLRRPVAVGLLATAGLGVPSAVVSIGLAQDVLDAGQAAAIISAVLATIAVSAAGGAVLSRRAGRAHVGRRAHPRPDPLSGNGATPPTSSRSGSRADGDRMTGDTTSVPTTMRAVVLDAPGPPEALRIRELPVPTPQPGWVLIRVTAFGLNRSELHTRLGLADGVTFPRVPGIEATGVVAACPGGEFRPGQQVMAMMGGMGRTIDGGYAEYTCVPATQVIGFRSDLDAATLGAVPEMLQTAHGSLTVGLDARPGQTLLVRGGTSSVGLAAAVLAKRRGLTVLATTRDLARADVLTRAGVDHPVLDDGTVAARVRAIVPDGVDVALELVGTTTLPDTLAATRVHGVVCFTGMLSNQWTVPDFYPIDYLPRGVRLAAYGGDAADLPADVLQGFLDDVAAGRAVVPLARVFDLDGIVEAHTLMEHGSAGGKLVVIP